MACHSVLNGLVFAVLNRGEPLGPGGFRLFLPSGHPLSLIASTMVSGFFLGGMVRMAGRQIRGGAPRLEDLFSITDCWFDLLLASFLIGLATSIGVALFIVPGFVVFGLFMLAIPLVAEGHLPATGGAHPELACPQVPVAHRRGLSLGPHHPDRFRYRTLLFRPLLDRPALLPVDHPPLPQLLRLGACPRLEETVGPVSGGVILASITFPALRSRQTYR